MPKCQVIRNIDCDHKLYKAGDTIELTDEQAAKLPVRAIPTPEPVKKGTEK